MAAFGSFSAGRDDAMTDLSSVTDATFRDDVLDAQTPVLVDFWAVWSGASRALGAHLRSLAEEMGGRVRIVKLNIDENTRTPLLYQIRSIPTLLLFKDGQVVDQMTGNPGRTDVLASFVDRHVRGRSAEHTSSPPPE